MIAGRHWEYEGTISGVTSSDCMLIVGAAPRDAPLTQERSPGKKSVGFFFFFFFRLKIWRGRGKLMLYKQPAAHGPHFGKPRGVLYL